MTWGWQDVASAGTVAAAASYLVFRFAPWPSKKSDSGCGSCPMKSAAGGNSAGCGVHPPVVSIGFASPAPRRPD